MLSQWMQAQQWQPLVDFPGVERDDAVGFRIGDTFYVGSGLSPWWAPQADFYGFDMVSQQWFSVAGLPQGMARQYATGFVVNGKGFVFGGYNGASYLNDLWRYNPIQNTWDACAQLPGLS